MANTVQLLHDPKDEPLLGGLTVNNDFFYPFFAYKIEEAWPPTSVFVPAQFTVDSSLFNFVLTTTSQHRMCLILRVLSEQIPGSAFASPGRR